MADVFPQSNAKPDQGRGFISSVLQKLPYANIVQDVDDNNPKYELFNRISKNREYKVLKQSVITGPYMDQTWQDQYSPTAGFNSDKGYHQYIYAKLDSDKIRRLSEYRRMAAFAEVSDCLDEICDEFVNKDDNNRVITINFNGFSNLGSEERTEIEKEFYRFINVFELERRGWQYCRSWLVEGEVFFENIVHSEKTDLGIVGALPIPGDLINPVYSNSQNTVIDNFLFQKPVEMKAGQNGQPPLKTTNAINSLQQQIIPLDGKQVTYIHSGIWNEDFTIRVPFIENCRRAYKQVSLLEDAIVIYRMVRAPERLKFKIDVGSLPPAKAEAYIRQMMQQYRSRKSFDGSSSQPGASNVYEPMSMLDDYWFARRNGETGSDVELMPAGQNISELADLTYFVKKLYQSLKVPQTRINPDQAYTDGAQILREELKFAKFIIRIQQAFAQGFKQAFVTHLKLRNWWKEYSLHESCFDLSFTPPSSYFAIRQQQLFELKYTNFNNMAQNESISKTFAQRYYLNLSDDKISENMEWMRKDASLKWELDQIAQFGPNWRDHLNAMSEGGEGGEAASGGGGGGAPMGTSPSEIPDFGAGGAAPEAGGEGGETAPEAGGAAPEPSAAPPAEAPTQ